jgi:predicted transcriptional regulator with HTH domain
MRKMMIRSHNSLTIKKKMILVVTSMIYQSVVYSYNIKSKVNNQRSNVELTNKIIDTIIKRV